MEIGRDKNSEFYGDWYGFRTMYAFYNGSEWEHTHAFPRVTICDFEVRCRMDGLLSSFSN